MKKVLIWIAAAIISFSAMIYQKKTGPTYPKKAEVELNNNVYELSFKRTHGGITDCPIELEIADNEISGTIIYRRFPTNETWDTIQMTREGRIIIGSLPNQPPAGKLEYFVKLQAVDKIISSGKDEKIIIRFKGAVPNLILIPHVIIMIIAMLLSNVAGIFALFKNSNQKLYGVITLFSLFLGGMVFGPIMQWYAFGEAWTGIPFGWDLTDNKTLIAVIAWIIAVVANRKSDKPTYTLVASIVMFFIYFIPHSLLGSEFDHETGKVVTGFIHFMI